jgi:hypothetical protein
MCGLACSPYAGNKKAHVDLSALPEIARVRCQWLRRESGSIRIVLFVCVGLRQDNRV